MCMETILFWIAWALISSWALKSFYYSFSEHKINRLRTSALGINLAVLTLTFLPWLPRSLGGGSGFSFLLQGNIFAMLFFILLITSISLFLTKTSSNLKIAASATIANTVVLFAFIYQLRPDTFILTLFDIVPIIAFFAILVGDLVVLLLWQQLQLKERKSKRKS